jgi:hypothetical protein
MIELLSAPSLKLEDGVWTLVFWYCEAFDRARSFRELIRALCGILNKERVVHLSLPTEEDGEDFVEGSLSWGPAAYDVYFEYSLGYLQLSSASEQAIREMAGALKAHLIWASDSMAGHGPA